MARVIMINNFGYNKSAYITALLSQKTFDRPDIKGQNHARRKFGKEI